MADPPAALFDRLLVHVDRNLQVVVEVADVYLLEADGKTTIVRLRDADPLRDHRRLGDLEAHFAAHGLLRIHRNHMINLHRVREIRRRSNGQDWELKLDPPVNRILPVARGRERELLAAFGEC